MKNTFKKIAASMMAIASLATAVTGVSASAADLDTNVNPIVIEEYSSTHSYSYSVESPYAWESSVFYASGSFTVSFPHATYGAADVDLYYAPNGYSNGSKSGGYFYDNVCVIPHSAGTTLYVTASCGAGYYYFSVRPTNGYTYTSGTFSTNAS